MSPQAPAICCWRRAVVIVFRRLINSRRSGIILTYKHGCGKRRRSLCVPSFLNQKATRLYNPITKPSIFLIVFYAPTGLEPWRLDWEVSEKAKKLCDNEHVLAQRIKLLSICYFCEQFMGEGDKNEMVENGLRTRRMAMS